MERLRAADGVTGVPTFFVRHGTEAGTMLVNPSEAELAAALASS
jgi:hypothetical protein